MFHSWSSSWKASSTVLWCPWLKFPGIKSSVIKKPHKTSQAELLDVVTALNAEPSVNGVLVQLPLPEHISERKVCDAIHPDKDVDGFHMSNIGKLCLDVPNLIPATAYAVWELLQRSGMFWTYFWRDIFSLWLHLYYTIGFCSNCINCHKGIAVYMKMPIISVPYLSPIMTSWGKHHMIKWAVWENICYLIQNIKQANVEN